MIFKKHLHWFLYPLFFLACARQTSPTGGPKDTIPPVLASSIPIKEKTNFEGKQVELYFSEMIQLANPKEQIIITPDVAKEYEVEARKDKVVLKFEKDLKDSTTYSINFRDAVQDLTEKNPAVNLKLAFSTGPFVDSLSIEGKVYDLLKANDAKDATVLLYQTDTFNIFKHKPVYLTKTDEKGNYKIENLKPGNYFVYTIDDKNRNLVADSKSESFGFRSDTIQLHQNQKNISIPLIRLDTRPLKLTSARPYSSYFNIKTGKNLEHYTLRSNETDTLLSAFGEDKANIRIYNTFHGQDSVLVHFHATDSLNNSLDTALYVKFSKRETLPDKFEVQPSDFKVIERSGALTGKIRFTKPLIRINYDSILYKIDSAHTVTFTASDLRWDSLNNILSIEKKIDKNLLIKPTVKPSDKPQPKAKPIQGPPIPKEASDTTKQKKTEPVVEYQLYIGDATFISAERDSSQQIAETLKPIKLEETGVIIIQVQTDEPHFIVELLDKSFTVIKSARDTKKTSFEDLRPGEYQVRVIQDTDNNGKWSPGNFFLRREPERIAFYKTEKNTLTINLKANWEIGPLLIKL